MLGFVIKWNVLRLNMIVFMKIHAKFHLKLKKYYAETISKTTGIEIQSQHWGENFHLSMEGIAVKYFPN